MKLILENKTKFVQIGLTVILFFIAKFVSLIASVTFGIYLLAYLIIGHEVIYKAFLHLFQGEWFDENFLMMVATIGAICVKQYPEAVTVMLFYEVGELLEDIAVERSKDSITHLLDIRPEYANVIRAEEVVKVDPAEVKVAEVIKVTPGEKIPLDGVVIEGKASLDTAALTGESEPRAAEVDEQVLSGSIVLDGVLLIKVTKEYGESTVAQILDLVENASQQKAPTERFITKFAKVYTPIVVFLAVVLAIIPPLFLVEPFKPWIYRALIFLVISCPCALVISIPLGFFAGIGAASRKGVLVKGSNYLELLTQIKTLVFDKTGTLTKGNFTVLDVYPAETITKKQLITLAALAESHSPHPIARSIVEYFPGKLDLTQITNVKEEVGQGVSATYQDQLLLVGKKTLLEKHGVTVVSPENVVAKTLIYVSYAGIYQGCLVIADELKPTAKQTIANLKQKNINSVMLTGDRTKIAQVIAKEVGIDEVKAELLPQDKLREVKALEQATDGKVGFVGDGLNDTPVLMQADVGISMGALGSDAAIQASDVVLMRDDPQAIISAIDIAKKTKQIVWQNIILALGLKFIFLLLGALGDVTMWEAVFADVGVTLIAVLNALRIMHR